MSAKILNFQNREEASKSVAKAIAIRLSDSIEKKGKACLMLSGGSTPIMAYRHLAQADLDWSKVHSGLVDDRWVPPKHPKSNEGMLHREMTTQATKNLLSMWENTESPFNSVDVIIQRYKRLLDIDVVVLGMGVDGHTASWFPESAGVQAALDINNSAPIAAIDATGSEVAGDTPLRITLTLSAVAKAKHVILMIFGKEKGDLLTAVLQGDSRASDLPITKAYQTLGSVMTVYRAN